MCEEEEVREGCPKVRTINVGLSGTLRVKNVLQCKKKKNDTIQDSSHVLERQPPCKPLENPTESNLQMHAVTCWASHGAARAVDWLYTPLEMTFCHAIF